MIHAWVEDQIVDADAKMAEALGYRAAGVTAYDFHRGRKQALIDVRSALVEASDKDRGA